MAAPLLRVNKLNESIMRCSASVSIADLTLCGLSMWSQCLACVSERHLPACFCGRMPSNSALATQRQVVPMRSDSIQPKLFIQPFVLAGKWPVFCGQIRVFGRVGGFTYEVKQNRMAKTRIGAGKHGGFGC